MDYTHYHTLTSTAYDVDTCERCGCKVEGPNAVTMDKRGAKALGLILNFEPRRLPEAGHCDAFGGAVCDECFGKGPIEDEPETKVSDLTETVHRAFALATTPEQKAEVLRDLADALEGAGMATEPADRGPSAAAVVATRLYTLAEQAKTAGRMIDTNPIVNRERDERLERCRSLVDELTADPEPAGPTCPGCSGTVADLDSNGVGVCQGCGGCISTEPLVSRSATVEYIDRSSPMLGEPGPAGQFYFDLQYRVAGGPLDRMHGWADRATRRVVQWG